MNLSVCAKLESETTNVKNQIGHANYQINNLWFVGGWPTNELCGLPIFKLYLHIYVKLKQSVLMYINNFFVSL
jgi:hypothetical protein